MCEEDRFWIRIWGIVASTLISIAIVASLYSYYTKVRMAELNFEEVTIQGADSTVYQKIR